MIRGRSFKRKAGVYVPPPSGWPAWRQGLPLDTIASISGTASMNGIGGAGLAEYNGFTGVGSKWHSVAAGGHASSAVNAVFAVDLSLDAPQWTTLHSGSASLPSDQAAAGPPQMTHYPDGLPVSRHTYYDGVYVPQRNRIIHAQMAAPWGGSGNAYDALGTMDAFRLDTNVWDPGLTFPSAPAPIGTSSGPGVSVCVNPATGDIYAALGSGTAVHKWTQATNTWSTINPTGGHDYGFVGSLIDVARNRWVSGIAGAFVSFNLTTLVFTEVGYTGALPPQTGSGIIVHDTHNDRYILVTYNGSVYRIHPDTLDMTWITNVGAFTQSNFARTHYFHDLGGVASLPAYTDMIKFIPTRLSP